MSIFDLKDDKAVLNAIIWKPTMRLMRLRPEAGLEVVATGKVTTYPGSSRYQLIVEQLRARRPRCPHGDAGGAQEEARRRRSVRRGAQGRRAAVPCRRSSALITLADGRGHPRHHAQAERPLRPRRQCCYSPWRCMAKSGRRDPGLACPRASTPSRRTVPDVLIVARGDGSIKELMAFNEEGGGGWLGRRARSR